MSLAPGTKLGHYEILSPIGAGGMGEVYRARDLRLAREVAIKVLPADQMADPQARRRFQNEARAVALLSHPNILAIHEFDNEGNVSFAVTELLSGETLAQRLRRGRERRQLDRRTRSAGNDRRNAALHVADHGSAGADAARGARRPAVADHGRECRDAATHPAVPGSNDTYLVRASVLANDRVAARHWLAELEPRVASGEAPAAYLGFAYSAMGDRDRAFEFLNRALEAREPPLRDGIRSPMAKELRGDPRYADLLDRLARGF